MQSVPEVPLHETFLKLKQKSGEFSPLFFYKFKTLNIKMWFLGILCFFILVSFYIKTYDSYTYKFGIALPMFRKFKKGERADKIDKNVVRWKRGDILKPRKYRRERVPNPHKYKIFMGFPGPHHMAISDIETFARPNKTHICEPKPNTMKEHLASEALKKYRNLSLHRRLKKKRQIKDENKVQKRIEESYFQKKITEFQKQLNQTDEI